MSYEYIDDIATADCAVEIRAETLPDTFVDAARSLIGCMVDLDSVRSDRSWSVELEEEDIRDLLYAWLSELVFLRDSENALFSSFDIESLETDGVCSIKATVRGEPIDHSRHDITVDVKAVTMHMFSIERQGTGWKAFVIYDL